MLGGDQDSESLVVQAARDVLSGFLFAHVVPQKGLAHIHVAAMLEEDVKRLGHDTVTIKADNEPAMMSLHKEVPRRREKSTLIENSPVGQSQSNGVAERAVQAVSEQIQVRRHGLHNRIRAVLPVRHPVMTWMVEHAGELVSAFQRGLDGNTCFRKSQR